MITLIGYAVVLVLVIAGVFAIINKWNERTSNNSNNNSPLSGLSENELIKKFNGLADLLGSSKKRDVDTIAEELKAVLKEYKCRKIEQFVESEQLLTKNKSHLKEEMDKLDIQAHKLESDAKALATNKESLSQEDLESGALIMAQISETKKLKDQLQKTYDENDKRFNQVEKQVKTFNVRYTLKETSISNMIVMAKTSKNISTVDLKLNDLISEFKDKVQDAEIEYNVKSQINGTTDETENPIEFDVNKDKYIEEFKNFVSK